MLSDGVQTPSDEDSSWNICHNRSLSEKRRKENNQIITLPLIELLNEYFNALPLKLVLCAVSGLEMKRLRNRQVEDHQVRLTKSTSQIL